MIVLSSTRFRPTVPSPVPVLTVTVRVEPEPETPVTDEPVTLPPLTVAKSELSTPVTDSLKVTVKVTDAAFVGSEPAREHHAARGHCRSLKVEWVLLVPREIDDVRDGLAFA